METEFDHILEIMELSNNDPEHHWSGDITKVNDAIIYTLNEANQPEIQSYFHNLGWVDPIGMELFEDEAMHTYYHWVDTYTKCGKKKSDIAITPENIVKYILSKLDNHWIAEAYYDQCIEKDPFNIVVPDAAYVMDIAKTTCLLSRIF